VEVMIDNDLRRLNVPVFKTRLHERSAYRAQFVYRTALHELDQSSVNGVPAAIENAHTLAAEIVAVLRDLQQARAAA
jgi:hypothetical protein